MCVCVCAHVSVLALARELELYLKEMRQNGRDIRRQKEGEGIAGGIPASDSEVKDPW